MNGQLASVSGRLRDGRCCSIESLRAASGEIRIQMRHLPDDAALRANLLRQFATILSLALPEVGDDDELRSLRTDLELAEVCPVSERAIVRHIEEALDMIRDRSLEMVSASITPP